MQRPRPPRHQRNAARHAIGRILLRVDIALCRGAGDTGTRAGRDLVGQRSLRTRRDRNSKRYDIAGVDGVIVQRELEGIGSRLRIYEAHRRAVDGRGQHNLVEGDSGHDQGENRAQAQHELHRFTHDLTSVVLAPSH